MRRTGLVALVAIFAVAMLSHRAWSSPPHHHHLWFHHGANYMFRDVTVEQGETVDGDLNVFFGNATIEGRVNGDLNVFGGSCDTTNGMVEGEVNCLQTASLGGIVPWVGNAFEDIPFAGESKHLSMTLFGNFIVFLMFLLFPMRVRLALARVETQPGLAAVIGLLACVAVIPLGILLILSIIGIPLIIIEFAAIFAACGLARPRSHCSSAGGFRNSCGRTRRLSARGAAPRLNRRERGGNRSRRGLVRDGTDDSRRPRRRDSRIRSVRRDGRAPHYSGPPMTR